MSRGDQRERDRQKKMRKQQSRGKLQAKVSISHCFSIGTGHAKDGLTGFLFVNEFIQSGNPVDRNRRDAQALEEKIALKKKDKQEEAQQDKSKANLKKKKVARKEVPSMDALLDEGLKKGNK